MHITLAAVWRKDWRKQSWGQAEELGGSGSVRERDHGMGDGMRLVVTAGIGIKCGEEEGEYDSQISALGNSAAKIGGRAGFVGENDDLR